MRECVRECVSKCDRGCVRDPIIGALEGGARIVSGRGNSLHVIHIIVGNRYS